MTECLGKKRTDLSTNPGEEEEALYMIGYSFHSKRRLFAHDVITQRSDFKEIR